MVNFILTLLFSTMKKLFLLATLLIFLNYSTKSQVVINEYSCANVTGFADNFGEFEDWIELYNTSASSANIGGFYLSDSKGNTQKYLIPVGTNIPGNGFLRFWASNQNTVVGGNIHTNFSLTQCASEEIVFSNTTGVIIDSITIKRNQKDHSRGRTTDGATTWSIFLAPTPSFANTNPFKEYEFTPTFNLLPGYYAGAQTVSLACTDVTANIHYTIDGSNPNATSPIYAAPINVAATTIIKAVAISTTDPLVPPSFMEPNTYFINVTHTVASISIGQDDFQAFIENNLPWGSGLPTSVTLEYFDPLGIYKFQQVGNSNGHGNDSWAYDQRGFDYICKDEYGYDNQINYKLFDITPRTKFDRIILKAGASDNYPYGGGNFNCHIRDAFVQSFSQARNFNLDCRSWEPCVVYVNGQYWGVYEIRERVDHHKWSEYYYNQKAEDIDMLKQWGGLNVAYGSDTAWTNLFNFVMANNMTNQNAYNYVEQRMDFNSVIDHAIYNTYIVNSDWINWNSLWWRGRANGGTKWRYCLWDQDNTYGLGQNFTGWPTTGWQADPCDLDGSFGDVNNPPGPNEGHLAILNKLLVNQNFKSLYINRYADLMNHDLDCDTVLKHLNWMVSRLTPEMGKHCARWVGGGWNPTSSVPDWQANLDTLRNFISNRCAFIDSALIGCYSLTGPWNVTVYPEPAGYGNVTLSTLTPAYYPYTGVYFGGIVLPFKATPLDSCYVFDHWEVIKNATGAQNLSLDTIKLNLTSSDTIIAHFTKICVAPGTPPVVPPVIVEPFQLGIPTAFSPNGDGKNDFFILSGKDITSINMKIYNRWGQLVFESYDLNKVWDGSYKKKPAPSDVYTFSAFVVKKDGTNKQVSGNITLLR
jgi:gliding motility-associated-like protein